MKLLVALFLFVGIAAGQQPSDSSSREKAEAVLAKAVETMGGQKYLNVTSQVSRGKFSIFRGNMVASFQSFTDVIVLPDKERTDFKGEGRRTIQVNDGDTGWIYDGDQELVKVQTEKQLTSFKEGLRTSLDNLLRGKWKGQAQLTYVGRRPATLGRRNDVIKLTFGDGFVVEFEFASEDGTPQKTVFKRKTGDGEEVREEDRYAQFVDINGIKAPFVIDRFSDGKPFSRINYETIEFNKPVPNNIFSKPTSPKEARKEIKI